MAWSLFKAKPPHRRPCPRCGVEDEKNGIFCFHCGAQILQTAILHRKKQKRSFALPLWLRRLTTVLAFLAALGALLWFAGDRLPFDPVRLFGLRILRGDGFTPQGTLLPRLSTKDKSFKVVGNLLFTPPRSICTVKVFDASKTKQRWKRNVVSKFFFHRFVLTFPGSGEASLVAGKYKIQVSRGTRVLEGLTFVVD